MSNKRNVQMIAKPSKNVNNSLIPFRCSFIYTSFSFRHCNTVWILCDINDGLVKSQVDEEMTKFWNIVPHANKPPSSTVESMSINLQFAWLSSPRRGLYIWTKKQKRSMIANNKRARLNAAVDRWSYALYTRLHPLTIMTRKQPSMHHNGVPTNGWWQ
jgi:hypothetical protein